MRSLMHRPAPPLHGAMLSDVGCVRTNNEDVVAFVLPGSDDPRVARGALALVADGMGGHACGEVASALAAHVATETYYASRRRAGQALEDAIHAANLAVFRASDADAGLRGMGTTLTMLAFSKGRVFVGHVGDSRAYRLRKGKIEQLTCDQSMVGQLVARGDLSEADARKHPERNVLLQSIGTNRRVQPEVTTRGHTVERGDVYLLCSDGLTDVLDSQTIATLLHDDAPQAACLRLIAAALAAHASDNVSVGVFRAEAPLAEVSADTRVHAVRPTP